MTELGKYKMKTDGNSISNDVGVQNRDSLAAPAEADWPEN